MMSSDKKRYNLNDPRDIERVLDILEDSDIDLSDDDENEDETWIPQNFINDENEYFLHDIESEKENIPGPSSNIDSTSTSSTLIEIEDSTLTQLTSLRSELWKEISFPNHQLPIVYGCQNLVKVGSPMDYFYNYFPPNHFNETALYTKMYSLSKFGNEINLSPEEIKNFYGCSIVMGCLGYPRVRMYWAQHFKNELISTTMSRDKFLRLRNLIHFVDTSKPIITNKLWRIQPIIDMVRNRCNLLATDITSYAIDEQMIPFTGRCPARQVIRSKPRPVGLKNLVCATSNGMIVDFEVFQGAGTFLNCGLGHGPSIVLRLVKFLPQGSHLYFDRFFTTIPLIEKLRELNYYATGTIMSNRLGKRLHFPLDKHMDRGDMKQFVKNDSIVVVKWCDTKCVTLVSSKCGKDPVGEVNRWIKNLKRRAPVPIPAAIEDYNAYMGGVDIGDQMMDYYRIRTKTKKWPIKAFFHFLDLAIYNSWMEYKKDAALANIRKKDRKDFLKFKLEIGTVLAKTKDSIPDEPEKEVQVPEGFYGTKYRPHDAPEDIRYDRYDHWPEFLAGTARRCRNRGCDSRTRARCQKCKVNLCIIKDKDCFKAYHTR